MWGNAVLIMETCCLSVWMPPPRFCCAMVSQVGAMHVSWRVIALVRWGMQYWEWELAVWVSECSRFGLDTFGGVVSLGDASASFLVVDLILVSLPLLLVNGHVWPVLKHGQLVMLQFYVVRPLNCQPGIRPNTNWGFSFVCGFLFTCMQVMVP